MHSLLHQVFGKPSPFLLDVEALIVLYPISFHNKNTFLNVVMLMINFALIFAQIFRTLKTS